MATGINILCYKSKTLASGEHPLMIRICKDGKKKYIGLGISVLPQFWDFKKNKPKRNCPEEVWISTYKNAPILMSLPEYLQSKMDEQYTPAPMVVPDSVGM